MPAKVFSSAIIGLDARPIEVEVDLISGLYSFSIVGLADKAIAEAKERVSAAIKNSGFLAPQKSRKKVTVNLAPADLKKEGAGYDLAIALGFILASGQAIFEPKDKIIIGELSLDGNLRPVWGIISTALMTKREGFKTLILPKENAKEASLIEGIEIIGAKNLKEIVSHLEGKNKIEPFEEKIGKFLSEPKYNIDMAFIKGQESAKRALEIAAAGGHNILMSGPPGGGKTLLAKALPSVLPKMNLREALEVTKIYSVSGLLKRNEPLILERPFRSPHHTSSEAAIIGGGNPPRPGEISLAHRGVLFLDEAPEFHRDVLESLRQPLEEGEMTVARAKGAFTFPANFILILAKNPCPCGHYNDPQKECTCFPSQIAKYQRKLSGPLLDRIDIHIEVPRVESDILLDERVAETSEKIRERIIKAREIQENRFLAERAAPGEPRHSWREEIFTNSEMDIPKIKKYCQIDSISLDLIRRALKTRALSARAYHRILKVARTIADLAHSENIKTEHIAEAIQYRTGKEE